MKSKHKHSLASKLSSLGKGQNMVIFNDTGYRVLMKNIEAVKLRSSEYDDISYKKACVVVGDEMHIGVIVARS